MLDVFIRQECFPSSISNVVPTDKFDVIQADFAIVDFSDTNFSSPDVATFGAKVFHSSESKFAQIAILNTRGNERHRNVALDTIDACPRGNEREHTGDEIDEGVRWIVFVSSCPP